MNTQDVIAFPQTEEQQLTTVFERQAKVSLLACELARLLYAARVTWIGDGMAWEDLTVGQRAGYKNEIEALIKGGQS